MKSFVSILFVSFLVWNYVGFFTYFHFEKQAAQKNFKRKLKLTVPKGDLKTFQFSPKEASQLNWHKMNEFEYQESMYDIVYSDTLENGDFIFTCISDLQETILFEKLGQFVAQDLNSDKHQPIKNWKVNFEKPYAIPEKQPSTIHLFEIIDDINCRNNYFFSLQSSDLSIETPPPNHSSI